MKDSIPTVLPAEDFPTVLPVHDIPEVEAVDVDDLPEVVRISERGFFGSIFHFIGSTIEWIFGVMTLIAGLGFLAVIPVAGFLSLGYLLEVGGRVARTGKLRHGFIGIRKAARVGGILVGGGLAFLPLWLVSSLAESAQLIDPAGPVARRWALAWTILAVATALHIVMACSRGGKLRHFLWPFTNPIWFIKRLIRGGYYAEARDAVWDFVASLRLPYYFWLGLRGCAGTVPWLAVPVALLMVGRRAPVVGFLGGLVLGVVLLYLPFLQMRFASENRFRALFEVRAVRQRFRRAPWAFAFAFLITLAFAIPLYLLKIEMIPREVGLLFSLVFIVFIWPARLLTGWAYGRAGRRDLPRHWFFRWTARLGMLPIAFFYVLIVYFTQFTSWNGLWSLMEQHAFLLPVPFVGM